MVIEDMLTDVVTCILQIVARIMENGFRDGENRTYRPHLIRFGRGQGKHVHTVSLDNLGACLRPVRLLILVCCLRNELLDLKEMLVWQWTASKI